ncbi:MAG: prephenate dehydrogenase/arogenate dehydrogenase family protein [Acidimicrobiia bacterium]|nr:prephenate dehydrogenase/arogenate dehydrogenase family protein [Acidimicrobiia bacterium]
MTVGVLGLGHIGGSLARALRAAGEEVVGWDADVEVRRAASEAGVDTEAPVAEADLVVVATPLRDLHTDVASMLDAVDTARTTVTDVASVKGPVLAAAAGHPAFVSGHPMAGTERSGWGAADPDLFRNAPWLVLVADGAATERVAAVCRLALAVGARPVPIHPQSHDRALATVSHLPHVLAAALTLQAEQHLPLAAGSLHGAARVAAGDPALPTAMVDLNREAVEAALVHLTRTLEQFRAAPDPARWFVSARAVWDRFNGRDLVVVERPLTPTGLRAVGEVGGHVIAVGAGTFTAEVPR